MLAAFLTTILFSFSALSGRRLANLVSGTQANLARLLVAALLRGLWSHLFGFGVGGAGFGILFVSGCVGFGIGDLALFQAYPRIGTRRTMVLVQCLAAPFGAFIEWAWLGHAPTLAQAGFGAVILVGVGIALMPAKAEAQPTHGLGVGIFFGTLAAVCQAGGAVLSRKAYAVAADAGAPLDGVSAGVNVAYQRLLGGILVSALFFIYLKFMHRPEVERRADWRAARPWIIANALAGPSFGVTFYQWALMTSPTNIVLPIVATTPLVVIFLTRVLEGEKITGRALAGGALSVGGVIGLTLAKA
ncbi:MAG: EamA family transporter [Verrucomicrobia bacterium]|nr:EamA family transporter [Verrucomicrobiota bacterium]